MDPIYIYMLTNKPLYPVIWSSIPTRVYSLIFLLNLSMLDAMEHYFIIFIYLALLNILLYFTISII